MKTKSVFCMFSRVNIRRNGSLQMSYIPFSNLSAGIHTAENLQSKALDTGRISYRQFRILQEKRQRVPTTHVAQPAETENTPLA